METKAQLIGYQLFYMRNVSDMDQAWDQAVVVIVGYGIGCID